MKSAKPIIFSGPMVQAILEGHKTMTRRILKPQGISVWQEKMPNGSQAWFTDVAHKHGHRTMLDMHSIGQKLWVRETWATGDVSAIYKADRHDQTPYGGWKSPIHMPRWASRITLEVTAVKIERLWDISEQDCIAEGVVRVLGEDYWVPGLNHPNRDFPYLSRPTPREMYSALWDTINGSGAWLGNPWVAAYTFAPSSLPAPTGDKGWTQNDE